MNVKGTPSESGKRHQRSGWLEDVALPVDRPARWDRMPRLIVDGDGDAPTPGLDHEDCMLAGQSLFVRDAKVPAQESAQFDGFEVLPARAPSRHQRHAPRLQVVVDPRQRAVLAVLVEVADYIAVNNRIEADVTRERVVETIGGALPKLDVRIALAAARDRGCAQLDADEGLEAPAKAVEHRTLPAADVEESSQTHGSNAGPGRHSPSSARAWRHRSPTGPAPPRRVR